MYLGKISDTNEILDSGIRETDNDSLIIIQDALEISQLEGLFALLSVYENAVFQIGP